MKSGTSGKPFTKSGLVDCVTGIGKVWKDNIFDRDKFITYKKHNDVLTALCRDGFGCEIDADVFIVRSVVRCPETLKCRTVVGRVRITDGFLKMSTERKKERILKTLKK
jgi:hypothetical protein